MKRLSYSGAKMQMSVVRPNFSLNSVNHCAKARRANSMQMRVQAKHERHFTMTCSQLPSCLNCVSAICHFKAANGSDEVSPAPSRSYLSFLHYSAILFNFKRIIPLHVDLNRSSNHWSMETGPLMTGGRRSVFD